MNRFSYNNYRPISGASALPLSVPTLGTQPSDIAAYALGSMLLVGLIFLGIVYYQRKNVQMNPGPWKFSPTEFPIVIRSDQLATVTQGSFSIVNYLYISGAREQRTNAQAIWRWGIFDPIRNRKPAMLASYIPAQEQLLLEFSNVATGDENSTSSIFVPNIVQQRWFHMAFAFEGRTVDIFVNGHHVKSLQLPNVLKQSSDGIQIIGNSGILGQMALWKVIEGRINEQQALADYKETSDTAGKPILPVDFSFSLANLPKLNFCPGMPWCEDIKGDCKTYVKYDYA